MPYIDRPKRPSIDESLEPVLKKIALGRDKGEIAYILWKIALAWQRQRGVSFNTHSDVKAVLADVRDEYHDRYMRPYEDKKRAENGDVL